MTDTWVRASGPATTFSRETSPESSESPEDGDASLGRVEDEERIMDHARYESALQTMDRARCDSLREFLG